MRRLPTSAQLLWAVILSVAGIALLFTALLTPPVGEIDPAVLVAYGEVSTFVAAILGIDYHYKNRSR
ncbi:MAG: hypothetical protein SPI72_04380 [Porphyromonas sp.]|nr:hypothetical protein [Porphyromonas sp.]